MNEKHECFAREYVVDLNATQAAIRAGYSAKTAGAAASRLLKNVNVQAAIERLLSERAQRTQITADMVVEELAKIAFANMQDYMVVGHDGDPVLDFSNLTREQAAALAEVTVEDFTDGRGEDSRDVRRVKFKLADKKGALVDLLKHLGGMTEKKDITLSGTINVFDAAQRAQLMEMAKDE